MLNRKQTVAVGCPFLRGKAGPFALGLALLTGLPGLVFAQAGLIQQRDLQQRELERQERSARERLEQQSQNPIVEGTPSPEATPEPEVLHFDLKKIETNESSILSQEEIRSVAEEYEGRSVTIKDLNEIVNRLDALYAKKGFVTAKALLPKQKIKGGVVQFVLVEAKLGKVTYEGNAHTREYFLNQRLEFSPGTLVDLRKEEIQLTRINRLNDMQVLLEPVAGTEPGTTDYKIHVQEPSQYLVDLFGDNQGPEQVGELRGGGNVRIASLLGLRDPLSVGAYGSEGVTSANAGYEVPITPFDTRLGFAFDYNDTQFHLAPSSSSPIINGQRSTPLSESTAYYGSLQLSQPFVATRRWMVRGFVEGAARQSESKLGGREVSFQDLRTVYGGIYGDWIDDYGSTNFSHRLGRVFYLHHTGGVENQDFYKYQGSVSRYQPFSRTVWAQLRMFGQVVSTNFVPSTEVYAAGGASSVRGYPEIYVAGVHGYNASLQVNALAPRTVQLAPGDRSQLGGFVFLDHAAVFNDVTHTTGRVRVSKFEGTYLASTGVGVFMNWTDYVSLQVSVGFPLSEKVVSGGKASDARLHFMIHVTPPVNRWVEGLT